MKSNQKKENKFREHVSEPLQWPSKNGRLGYLPLSWITKRLYQRLSCSMCFENTTCHCWIQERKLDHAKWFYNVLDFFNTISLENVHFLQSFKLPSLIHGHFHQCPSRRSIVLTFVCYWPNDLRGSKILLSTEAEYWICLIKKTQEKEQHFIDKLSMIVIYNCHRIWSMVAAGA